MIHDLSHILNAPLPEAVRQLKLFTVPQPSRSAPARTSLRLARPRPCDSLGAKAIPDCACEDRICNAGKGVVKHRVECQQCGEYVAKGPTNDAERSRAMRGNASQPVAAGLGGGRVDARATLLGGLPGALGLAATHRGPAARIDALPPASRITVNLRDHFNGSLNEADGHRLLVTRLHEALFIHGLDADYQPLWSKPLILNHELCANGAEDGRLIRHRDRWHVGFAGVKSGTRRSETRISQLVAELDDDFNATRITAPTFPGIRAVEKNWGWFEFADDLHFVYSISPHVVFRLRRDDGTLERFDSPNPFPWSGGRLSGGAPPVRVGDRYASWFHGSVETPAARIYNVGAYEFEATSPFKIIRQSPAPLLWADPATKPANSPAHAAGVVFPMGAILRDGEWLVSSGLHDTAVEILRWKAADVEGVLQ